MWKKYKAAKDAEKQLRQMIDSDWKCVSCEETHSGIFDLAAFAPDYWRDEEVYAPNSEIQLEGNFLSEDFCVIDGEHFFVRCVLVLPIKNLDHDFGFGMWASLSKSNFQKYIDGFDAGDFELETFWSSWFSNQIKGLDNVIQQKCWVAPQTGKQRPLVYFMEADHAGYIAQQDGLEPQQLIDIFTANGHSTEK